MTTTESPTLVQQAADALQEAERTGQPCRPIRDLLGTADDVDLAYAVARVVAEAEAASGRRVSGRKIGLTAPAVQAQLGVDQPDYGVLYADTCLVDGAVLAPGTLIQPRVEVEIAFVLGRDLPGGGTTAVDVISATDYVLPSIELVDSRIENWDIRIVDTVADNASFGRYVVGTRPVRLDDVDLGTVPMALLEDGEKVSEGIGAACMGNPVNAVAWLADTMAALGTPLQAGECIMSGALGPMVDMAPGREYIGDLGPLGRVVVSLAE